MTNPFEQLRNDKEKENNQELKDEIFDNSVENKNENIENSSTVQANSSSTEKDDEKLKTPPPINTYLLFSYFPIVFLFIAILIIARNLGCSATFSFTGGLIGGYALRFALNSIYKKLFIESYVTSTLYPFLTEIYGEKFTNKELEKMVKQTNKIFRKRYSGKNRIKTVSILKKDGIEYALLSFESLTPDKEVTMSLLTNGENTPTINDLRWSQEVRQVFINGFYVFWDHGLSVPHEFSLMNEEGVFTGTLIFESLEQAIKQVQFDEKINEDNIIHIETRGEIFRILEALTKIRLNAIVTMKNGTTFTAPADDLMNEFQKR